MYIPVLAQIADSFVLSKVRAATGDRLRMHRLGVLLLAMILRNSDYCAGHGMTVLWDVCHPSTEFKLLDVVDAGTKFLNNVAIITVIFKV
jgi:hypothetical protein